MSNIGNLFPRSAMPGARMAAFLLALVLCASSEPASDRLTILLDGSGPITASTTRQDLARSYGEENVGDQDVDIGEGETEPGTVLFAADPTRLIEILWKDPKTKNMPKFATITGKTSLWKTAKGISLGTSLKQLEDLNGRAFTLSGFGWDYSGTVLSWDGGALGKILDGNGQLIVRLYSEGHGVPESELNQVQGDHPFSSAHPIMQKINPRVYQIVWQFSASRR